jgi:hypothetical protein
MLLAFLLNSGCNAIVGPSKPDDNWHSYDSAHFRLFVRPGSFAEANQVRLAAVLDDQYVTTLERLGITYQGRISAFLYESASDAALESSRSGMGYPDTEAIRATCVAPLDASLLKLLTHEANHVIQRNAMGRPGTYLMSEGLASAVMSAQVRGFEPEAYWAWTAKNAPAVPAISVLIDDSAWSGSDVQVNAGVSLLAYLLDRAGPAPIRQLYQVRSRDLAAAMSAVYGRSLESLDLEWRAFCAARRTP